MTLDENVKAEAIRCLKGQRKRLLADAIRDGALLRFLFEEKIIPAKEVQTYLDEADRLRMPKVKASILEYQHRWLGTVDPLEDCEKVLADGPANAASSALRQLCRRWQEMLFSRFMRDGY